jgi:hypothetical protein
MCVTVGDEDAGGVEVPEIEEGVDVAVEIGVEVEDAGMEVEVWVGVVVSSGTTAAAGIDSVLDGTPACTDIEGPKLKRLRSMEKMTNQLRIKRGCLRTCFHAETAAPTKVTRQSRTL